MTKREQWGTRIGLVLAMAGNAVGLGNFLRFPVQAAQNGGGSFMIPYFIAFLLLGIPLMWVEWAIGRHGGKYNHGSLPGMFDVMWKHPIAKYLGAIGLFVSTTIVIYYTYIESWSLSFSLFSLSKEYFGEISFEKMSNFLSSYLGSGTEHFHSVLTAYLFMLLTLGINIYVLSRGISKGIELLAKIALPALFLFGIILAITVISIGTPDPVNHPDRSVAQGFAFIWNPNFNELTNAKIWLAASGQIFFTLSVGMGTLQAYASYLKEKDDLVLGGLATSSLNEFAEVILGSSIAIPIAVAFFGVAITQTIAAGGAYNLGFVSMPIIFQLMPMGAFLGFLWFLLLFFAGITSSVAMAQPLISFMKEQFNIPHKLATTIMGLLMLIFLQFVVFYYEFGFLDEMDYWAGTFGLVIVALSEVIIFGWCFGIDKGWRELNNGAEIKIPALYKYIIKYITPSYLLIILLFWTIQDAIPTLLFHQKDILGNPAVVDEHIPYRWAARGLMFLLFVALCSMVYFAWKRNYKNNVNDN